MRGILLLVCAALATIPNGTGWAQALTGTVTLTGNHPAEVAGLPPVAHAEPAATLDLEATIALRNRAALDQLLKDQQDPRSPRYHRWLTSAQFVSRFDPSQGDVDAVAQWLQGQGFAVAATSLAQRYVRFSGPVAAAERAFGTTIMSFGDGSAYSNITDPIIPARFGGTIGRIGGLDNFMHEIAAYQPPDLQPGAARPAGKAPTLTLLDSGPLASPSDSFGAKPVSDVTLNGTGPGFGPSDFYTFYDENLIRSGGITGTGGDCLAVVGNSDFTPGAVNLFNSTFALPPSNITTVLVDGSNPGPIASQDEALLDLEWSHTVAPGAPQIYYLGNDASASANGSIVDAIARAVSDNACGAISVTFSLCGNPASFYQQTVSPIYAQAAAQGQSIFVAAGDWGAAGVTVQGSSCMPATSRNVSELGSDPNVTQVGGTGFVPNLDGSGNDVGHVPESAWNDPDIGATGGGASAVYTKPAYQQGAGVPGDGARDVPDVALIASPENPGSFWGSTFNGSPIITCCVGGTSLAAPQWAGVSKLIAQLDGKRPGPLNPRIYALANAGQAESGFRDVTSGNNNFNGVAGFSAGPGFDLATGWGTVDLSTFANEYVSPPAPIISSVSSPIHTGASFTIHGSFFSPGAMVNFFIATANGPLNPGPLTPSATSSSQLTVPVAPTIPLGQGFVSVQVVNADLEFELSNPAAALLQGSAAAGIPTLAGINGAGLAPTSSNPAFATNNVQTVIVQGNPVILGGSGFDAANGVAVNVFCACPPAGNAGPVFVGPGSGGLTPGSLSFVLPANVPTGPASLAVINRGSDGSFSKGSNAVSVPVGAGISVSSVTQSATTITVTGTGFSTLMVINFFNLQGGAVVNLGGLGVGGLAKIPLNVIDSTRFTFSEPPGAIAGPAYVQALNPPFVPFTSSGFGPTGQVNLF